MQFVYSKALLRVTQSKASHSGISVFIHTGPRGHRESRKMTLSHRDHLSSLFRRSQAVPLALGASQHGNSIAGPLFWGQLLLVKYGAKKCTVSYICATGLLLHGLQTASENSLGHVEHQRFLSTTAFFLPLCQKGQTYGEFSSQQVPT